MTGYSGIQTYWAKQIHEIIQNTDDKWKTLEITGRGSINLSGHSNNAAIIPDSNGQGLIGLAEIGKGRLVLMNEDNYWDVYERNESIRAEFGADPSNSALGQLFANSIRWLTKGEAGLGAEKEATITGEKISFRGNNPSHNHNLLYVPINHEQYSRERAPSHWSYNLKDIDLSDDDDGLGPIINNKWHTDSATTIIHISDQDSQYSEQELANIFNWIEGGGQALVTFRDQFKNQHIETYLQKIGLKQGDLRTISINEKGPLTLSLGEASDIRRILALSEPSLQEGESKQRPAVPRKNLNLPSVLFNSAVKWTSSNVNIVSDSGEIKGQGSASLFADVSHPDGETHKIEIFIETPGDQGLAFRVIQAHKDNTGVDRWRSFPSQYLVSELLKQPALIAGTFPALQSNRDQDLRVIFGVTNNISLEGENEGRPIVIWKDLELKDSYNGKKVTWFSSNENIISNEGKIIAEGNAILTAVIDQGSDQSRTLTTHIKAEPPTHQGLAFRVIPAHKNDTGVDRWSDFPSQHLVPELLSEPALFAGTFDSFWSNEEDGAALPIRIEHLRNGATYEQIQSSQQPLWELSGFLLAPSTGTYTFVFPKTKAQSFQLESNISTHGIIIDSNTTEDNVHTIDIELKSGELYPIHWHLLPKKGRGEIGTDGLPQFNTFELEWILPGQTEATSISPEYLRQPSSSRQWGTSEVPPDLLPSYKHGGKMWWTGTYAEESNSSFQDSPLNITVTDKQQNTTDEDIKNNKTPLWELSGFLSAPQTGSYKFIFPKTKAQSFRIETDSTSHGIIIDSNTTDDNIHELDVELDAGELYPIYWHLLPNKDKNEIGDDGLPLNRSFELEWIPPGQTEARAIESAFLRQPAASYQWGTDEVPADLIPFYERGGENYWTGTYNNEKVSSYFTLDQKSAQKYLSKSLIEVPNQIVSREKLNTYLPMETLFISQHASHATTLSAEITDNSDTNKNIRLFHELLQPSTNPSELANHIANLLNNANEADDSDAFSAKYDTKTDVIIINDKHGRFFSSFFLGESNPSLDVNHFKSTKSNDLVQVAIGDTDTKYLHRFSIKIERNGKISHLNDLVLPFQDETFSNKDHNDMIKEIRNRLGELSLSVEVNWNAEQSAVTFEASQGEDFKVLEAEIYQKPKYLGHTELTGDQRITSEGSRQVKLGTIGGKANTELLAEGDRFKILEMPLFGDLDLDTKSGYWSYKPNKDNPNTPNDQFTLVVINKNGVEKSNPFSISIQKQSTPKNLTPTITSYQLNNPDYIQPKPRGNEVPADLKIEGVFLAQTNLQEIEDDDLVIVEDRYILFKLNATSQSGAKSPDFRVNIFDKEDKLLDTILLTGPDNIPTSLTLPAYDQSSDTYKLGVHQHSDSYVAPIPGELIKPGIKLSVDAIVSNESHDIYKKTQLQILPGLEDFPFRYLPLRFNDTTILDQFDGHGTWAADLFARLPIQSLKVYDYPSLKLDRWMDSSGQGENGVKFGLQSGYVNNATPDLINAPGSFREIGQAMNYSRYLNDTLGAEIQARNYVSVDSGGGLGGGKQAAGFPNARVFEHELGHALGHPHGGILSFENTTIDVLPLVNHLSSNDVEIINADNWSGPSWGYNQLSDTFIPDYAISQDHKTDKYNIQLATPPSSSRGSKAQGQLFSAYPDEHNLKNFQKLAAGLHWNSDTAFNQVDFGFAGDGYFYVIDNDIESNTYGQKTIVTAENHRELTGYRGIGFDPELPLKADQPVYWIDTSLVDINNFQEKSISSSKGSEHQTHSHDNGIPHSHSDDSDHTHLSTPNQLNAKSTIDIYPDTPINIVSTLAHTSTPLRDILRSTNRHHSADSDYVARVTYSTKEGLFSDHLSIPSDYYKSEKLNFIVPNKGELARVDIVEAKASDQASYLENNIMSSYLNPSSIANAVFSGDPWFRLKGNDIRLPAYWNGSKIKWSSNIGDLNDDNKLSLENQLVDNAWVRAEWSDDEKQTQSRYFQLRRYEDFHFQSALFGNPDESLKYVEDDFQIPDTLNGKSIQWTSSNPNILSNEGEIIGTGSATLTASFDAYDTGSSQSYSRDFAVVASNSGLPRGALNLTVLDDAGQYYEHIKDQPNGRWLWAQDQIFEQDILFQGNKSPNFVIEDDKGLATDEVPKKLIDKDGKVKPSVWVYSGYLQAEEAGTYHIKPEITNSALFIRHNDVEKAYEPDRLGSNRPIILDLSENQTLPILIFQGVNRESGFKDREKFHLEWKTPNSMDEGYTPISEHNFRSFDESWLIEDAVKIGQHLSGDQLSGRSKTGWHTEAILDDVFDPLPQFHSFVDHRSNLSLNTTSAVIIGDASGTGRENGNAITGTLTATDVEGLTDGTIFSIESNDAASNGTATIDPESGAWSYTPNANFNGTDSFTATITDDLGGTTTQQINLTIAAVNDAAVISGDTSGTGEEDGNPITGTLSATDVEGLTDGTIFSIESNDAASNGTATIDPESGVWSYTPNDNFNGTDSFTATITDDLGGTTTQQIDLTITAVDDAAVISGDTSGTGEEDGNPITGTLSATDVEGLTDGTYFSIESGNTPTNGTASIDPESGVWSYTPNDNFNGTDSFIVTITDDAGGTTTKQINLTITPVDDQAVVTGDTTASVTEDSDTTTVTGSIAISDVDSGDSPYFPDVSSTTSINGYGAFSLSSGIWTYTLDNDNTTVNALNDGGTLSDSFNLTASDNSIQSITITINGATDADAAVISGDTSGSAEEDIATITGTLTATDPQGLTDGTIFSIESNDAASNGTATIDPESGVWSYTPNDNFNGTDSFTATITDDLGGTTTQQIDLTITAVDDAAVISGDTSGTGEEDGNPITGTLSATDVEGLTDGTYFSIESGNTPTNGTASIDPESGVWSYTPNDNFNGTDSFTVTITDDAGGTTTKQIDLTITPVDDQAVVTGDTTASVTEDSDTTTVTGSIAISDVDSGDSPYFPDVSSTTSINGYGAFSLSSGIWTYTLDNDNTTVNALNDGGTLSDSFNLTASDNSIQSITITINGATDADAAVISGDTSGSAEEDIATITGTLTATDPQGLTDGTIFSIESNDAASNGTATIDPESGVWSYTPNDNFNGTDSFTATITDDLGGTTTQQIDLTITAVDDAAVISGDTSGTGEEDGDPITGTLYATDVEGLTDGTYFSIESGNTPTNGTASIDTASGVWSYTPNANFNGTDSFTATITDDLGGTTTQQIDLNITAVDDPAVISGDTSGTGEEDGDPITGTLYATDVEGLTDGTYFSIESGNTPTNGTASIDPESGVWSYTPNANFYGTDAFTVTVTDDLGGTTTKQIDLTITPVDDPAVISGDTSGTGEEDGDPFTGTLYATDVEGLSDGSYFSVSIDATYGTASIDSTTGHWSYTPNKNFFGDDSFSVTVTDDFGGITTQKVQLSITASPSREFQRASQQGLFQKAKIQSTNSVSSNQQRAALGDAVTLNDQALAFEIANLNKGSSSDVYLDLDLVGGDLKPSANNQYLAYYSIENSGLLSSLTYNPRHDAGARFYDRSGNNEPDFIHLSLIDGGYGDKDDVANGTIVDPSLAATVDLNPSLTLADTKTLLVHDTSTSAPAAIRLGLSLENRTSTLHNIYYLCIETGESLDQSLDDLKARSRHLLSSLENHDVTLPESITLKSNLAMINGQRLRFFAIENAEIDQLNVIDDPRLQWFEIQSSTTATSSFDLTTADDLKLNLSQAESHGSLADLIAQEQHVAPLLDFRSFTAKQSIDATVQLAREANYNSTISFYKVIDTDGSVLDPITNKILKPGDNGYADAAQHQDNIYSPLSGLSVADNRTSQQEVSINVDSLLAPVAVVDNNRGQINTFFAFGEANTDGIAHFKSMGSNCIGLEDLRGGGDNDFDDLLFFLDDFALKNAA